ncbi:MAG: CBS domain-containing protein [Deltaproteobacteria bacterium]|nr:CBS domain-containing protein [Deltaproteobacteria bacterium]
MTTSIQLLPSDTIGDAFGQMETAGVIALPVVDRKRRILGTVTEADLRRHVAKHGRGSMFSSTLDRVLEDLPRAA